MCIMQRSLPNEGNDEREHSFTVGPFDVLCGRGKKVQKNPGNVAFLNLIVTNKNRYSNATRTGKIQIAREIVSTVRQQKPPGRFLDYDPTLARWVDIGDNKAFEKVRQALRDNNSATRRKSLSSSRSASTEDVLAADSKQSLDQLVSCSEEISVPSEFCDTIRKSHSDSEVAGMVRLSPLLLNNELFPDLCNETWMNADEWSLDMAALTDDNDIHTLHNDQSLLSEQRVGDIQSAWQIGTNQRNVFPAEFQLSVDHETTTNIAPLQSSTAASNLPSNLLDFSHECDADAAQSVVPSSSATRVSLNAEPSSLYQSYFTNSFSSSARSADEVRLSALLDNVPPMEVAEAPTVVHSDGKINKNEKETKKKITKDK